MTYPLQSGSDPDRLLRARSPKPTSEPGNNPVLKRVTAMLRRLAAQSGGKAFCLIPRDGHPIHFNVGEEPAFTVRVHRQSALNALASLDALTIAHAYIDGDFDFEGDLLAAFGYQERLSDFHPAIYLWRRLQPILVGRPRLNPSWIALHYDADNAQLLAADATWHTYTPGIYSSENETLEAGADRKLQFAFDAVDGSSTGT